MLVTASEIFTEVKPEQPKNVHFLMVVTPSGIVIDFKPES